MSLAWMALVWALRIPQPILQQGVPPEATPIIGGDQVIGSQWASVVAILSGDPTDPRYAHLCTGTLIAPHIVLTAAHCLPEGVAVEKISVYFGTEMTAKHRASVVRYGRHPDACTVDCQPDAFDFAFLEIAETVKGVKIVPVLSDQAEWDETMGKGSPVTFVGFGAIREVEDDDDVLADQERGSKFEVTTVIREISVDGAEFIAGEKGRDTCSGDSGGPGFVQLPDGEWRHVGVTSRGVRPCGSGYGFYGIPFFALPWLRDEAGVNLLPEGCEDGDCLDTRPSEGCGCNNSATPTPISGLFGVLALLGLGRRRRVTSGRCD